MVPHSSLVDLLVAFEKQQNKTDLLTYDSEDVHDVRPKGHPERQTSSPNDSKLFPPRFDFFFGAFSTLSPSLPLSSPSVTIRRLSLLELELDFAFEDEKDRLGAVCFDLATPFGGCFLLSPFVESSSGIGREGSPFSIQRAHEHGQHTTRDTTTKPFRLSFSASRSVRCFPAFNTTTWGFSSSSSSSALPGSSLGRSGMAGRTGMGGLPDPSS